MNDGQENSKNILASGLVETSAPFTSTATLTGSITQAAALMDHEQKGSIVILIQPPPAHPHTHTHTLTTPIVQSTFRDEAPTAVSHS